MAGCLTVARLDVWRHQLPEELKGVQLTSLPLLLVLPARRKEPPFALPSLLVPHGIHASPSRVSRPPVTPREGPVRYRTLEL